MARWRKEERAEVQGEERRDPPSSRFKIFVGHNDERRVHRDGWYLVYLVSRYRGYHLLIKLFGIPRWTEDATLQPTNTCPHEQHEFPRGGRSMLGPATDRNFIINVICYRGSSLLWLVINRYRALSTALFKGRKIIWFPGTVHWTQQLSLLNFILYVSFCISVIHIYFLRGTRNVMSFE